MRKLTPLQIKAIHAREFQIIEARRICNYMLYNGVELFIPTWSFLPPSNISQARWRNMLKLMSKDFDKGYNYL